MIRFRARLLCAAMVCFVYTALPARGAAGGVGVEKSPPAISTRTFDPARPPKEMPPLSPGEAALTETDFNCDANIGVQITNQDHQPGHCKSQVRIDSIKVRIRMTITIWLPEGAPDKLKAHENGHRVISEKAYAGAEKAARDLAGRIMGQTRVGEAADCQAAAKAAITAEAQSLCSAYLEAVEKPSSRVQDAYDRITDHGRNHTPEEKAIQDAYASAAAKP